MEERDRPKKVEDASIVVFFFLPGLLVKHLVFVLCLF